MPGYENIRSIVNSSPFRETPKTRRQTHQHRSTKQRSTTSLFWIDRQLSFGLDIKLCSELWACAFDMVKCVFVFVMNKRQTVWLATVTEKVHWWWCGRRTAQQELPIASEEGEGESDW